jgi:glycosidase
MIMTDRFANGDRSNDNFGKGEYLPGNLWYYQGGDWRGIIQHLDYIAHLGVTAIWISPVVLNKWEDKPYHGYAAEDFYSPDNHFGTMEDLRELVREAHQRGIKVIFDLVLNHTADFQKPGKAEWWNENRKPAPPFDNLDWYHHNKQMETHEEWNYPPWCEILDFDGLDDLAQEKPEVAEELVKVGKYWFEQTGCDGYRLDAAKHMDKKFLKRFNEEMLKLGVKCFGEYGYWDPVDLAKNADYTWGIFEYPMMGSKWWKGVTWRVFLDEESCRVLHEHFKKDSLYPNPNRLVTCIDSHDSARFQSFVPNPENYTKLKLALAFIFSIRGIPMVYYGTEQGFNGSWDPLNREPMFDPYTGEPKYFNENHEVYKWIQLLCKIRRSSKAMSIGRQLEVHWDDETYGFLREFENERVLCLLNNSSEFQSRKIFLPRTAFETGELLVDVLTLNKATVVREEGDRKYVNVRLAPKELRIFFPLSRIGNQIAENNVGLRNLIISQLREKAELEGALVNAELRAEKVKTWMLISCTSLAFILVLCFIFLRR